MYMYKDICIYIYTYIYVYIYIHSMHACIHIKLFSAACKDPSEVDAGVDSATADDGNPASPCIHVDVVHYQNSHTVGIWGRCQVLQDF